MNPQSQQASLALAAHLAVHGYVSSRFLAQLDTQLTRDLGIVRTGPVSATAVPTGTALSRLLALTDALTFALEVSRCPVSTLENIADLSLLSRFSLQDENPLDSLRTVVSDYFTDAGVVKFGLYDKTAQLSKVFGEAFSGVALS